MDTTLTVWHGLQDVTAIIWYDVRDAIAAALTHPDSVGYLVLLAGAATVGRALYRVLRPGKR